MAEPIKDNLDIDCQISQIITPEESDRVLFQAFDLLLELIKDKRIINIRKNVQRVDKTL
ncbi:MAG: hypothetical protein WC805_03820 [Patescibacteria group bacterium]|jgi:hypothetical protein